MDVELNAPTDCMGVRTRVVRVRPTGGGRYEIAMEFVGMSEEDRTAVQNLARHGKRRASGVFISEEKREKLIEALRMPDYYKLLGVSPEASVEEIHKAYRVLARKYHPDVCHEEGAQQRFCAINDAHDTLGEPEKRAAYDAMYVMRIAA
jgi:DnaJ-domain-containing protein 1